MADLLTMQNSRKAASLPKVKEFLESISRNSIKSKKSYSSGITLLQNFLNYRKQDHQQEQEDKEKSKKYQGYTCQTILQPLGENRLNVYELFNDFIQFLLTTKPDITPNSVSLYISAIRSYFSYYDIDVIPSKFKRKVKMPKLYREDEQALDVKDIRNILLNCNNRRLKAYLLVLASGGMRAVEATAIRLKDIDFSVSPTKIQIRKEYSKTKAARQIYISDEATKYLKQWIDWKYNRSKETVDEQFQMDKEILNPNTDLVFSIYTMSNEPNPNNLYVKLITEFQKLLTISGMDERKEEGIHKRRKITLHSFRRFVKTVISDQTNQDYSEWFLGHNKSPYYTKKEPERREIYATKCMKYLTFLDYTTLEATGKNIEAKLTEKEREIQLLRQRDSMNTDAISNLSDQLSKVMQEIEIIKQQK